MAAVTTAGTPITPTGSLLTAIAGVALAGGAGAATAKHDPERDPHLAVADLIGAKAASLHGRYRSPHPELKSYVREPPMSYKQILFRSVAREKLLNGTRALADAIRVPLGPKSKSVLIQRKWGGPIVCNDGVTIAKGTKLRDPEEDLGAHAPHDLRRRSGEQLHRRRPVARSRWRPAAPRQALDSLGKALTGRQNAGTRKAGGESCLQTPADRENSN